DGIRDDLVTGVQTCALPICVAVLGASEDWLPRYRTHGLHSLYHGDEAVVEVERFSLEGRAIRKVRQSVHRLEREGFRAQALHPRSEERRVGKEWSSRSARYG